MRPGKNAVAIRLRLLYDFSPAQIVTCGRSLFRTASAVAPVGWPPPAQIMPCGRSLFELANDDPSYGSQAKPHFCDKNASRAMVPPFVSSASGPHARYRESAIWGFVGGPARCGSRAACERAIAAITWSPSKRFCHIEANLPGKDPISAQCPLSQPPICGAQ